MGKAVLLPEEVAHVTFAKNETTWLFAIPPVDFNLSNVTSPSNKLSRDPSRTNVIQRMKSYITMRSLDTVLSNEDTSKEAQVVIH